MRFRDKYAFLSNFHPVEIFHMDVLFPSAEHAYQAAKSNNKQVRQKIALLETPGMAKQAGRSVWPIRSDWDKMKLEVMEDILRIKFSPSHIELRRKLMETNPERLVEDNHWNDTYWGVCNGLGENHLGLLLMKIRSEVLEDDWSTRC